MESPVLTTPFEQALEMIEQLPAEDQENLIEIVQRRLINCVCDQWSAVLACEEILTNRRKDIYQNGGRVGHDIVFDVRWNVIRAARLETD
jgi:hypothetical protein